MQSSKNNIIRVDIRCLFTSQLKLSLTEQLGMPVVQPVTSHMACIPERSPPFPP